MLVKRAIDKEKEIVLNMQQFLQEKDKDRKEGIHVSDLVNPLKAYHEKKNPTPLSMKETGYFFSGMAFEDFFDKTIAEQSGVKPKNRGEWNGIHYEMDFLDETFDPEQVSLEGIPIEVKSTRSEFRYKTVNMPATLIDDLSSPELEDFFKNYIEQIKKYMIISWSSKAVLVIFFHNLVLSYKKSIQFGKKEPAIRVYEILFIDEKEMHDEYYKMFETRDLLINALATNDPSKLPACEEWLCKVCKHFGENCPGAASLKSKDPLCF